MELWEAIVGSLIIYTFVTSQIASIRISLKNSERFSKERYYFTTFGAIKLQVGNYSMVALLVYIAYHWFS